MTTITWQYDSDDWQVAAGKATPEQVDQNYMDFINAAKTGKFDTVRMMSLPFMNGC